MPQVKGGSKKFCRGQAQLTKTDNKTDNIVCLFFLLGGGGGGLSLNLFYTRGPVLNSMVSSFFLGVQVFPVDSGV